MRRLFGLLLKNGFPLIGNVLKTLAKKVLILLGLKTAASATNAVIYKKMVGSGFTTLIILNEEMEDIIKIVKSLEDSGLLIKGLVKQLKMKKENKKENFLECF